MTWKPIKPAQVNWGENGVPCSDEFDDVYYNNESSTSGIEESKFVFLEGIDAPKIWQDKNSFTIVETGFGTGLNFFNTWQLWRETANENAKLNFVSVECSPLSKTQLQKALNPFENLSPFVGELLEQYPPAQTGFHNLLFDDERVSLTLLFGEAGKLLPKLSATVDAWFLDGFAPSKNPEMWGDGLFSQIDRLSAPQASIATFTAASDVRRGLQSIGFDVVKGKGFGKKRERITASRTNVKQTHPKQPKKVAIVGAGIAGCMLASKLNKSGVAVTLIDRHEKPAQETSSNPAALISPKLALGDDPYDRLLSLSFLHALNYYNALKGEDEIWLHPRGLLAVPDSDEKNEFSKKIANHFTQTHNWDDQFENLTSEVTRDKWSLKIKYDSCFYPQAGSINTRKLISKLCDQITYQQAQITNITNEADNWQLADEHGNEICVVDAVVIASGLDSYELNNTEPSPLTPNKGQISFVENSQLTNLPSLSFGHYLTAPFMADDGSKQRVIGASHKRMTPKEVTENNWREFEHESEEKQINALNQLTRQDNKPLGFKVGMRSTTIDHMPIVGQVHDETMLNTLPKHRQKIFPNDLGAKHHKKGMYIFTGLGARGYQLAPLLSAYLSAQIMGEPLPLDKDIIDAIHPARFKLRQRRKE